MTPRVYVALACISMASFFGSFVAQWVYQAWQARRMASSED